MMQAAITIEINGRRHEIHCSTLSGREIKALGHDEHRTLYRLSGEQRHIVVDDEIVALHDGERFQIERGPIHIIIEDEKYEAPRPIMTGSEIKALGHQPPANYLYRLDHGERILIEDDRDLHLRDGEMFITQPPCGHAS